MFTRKTLLISIVLFIFVSNFTLAQMCAKLAKVSAGEVHSLALMDDKTLWACGGSYDNYYQLGLGANQYGITSLKRIKGENGVGYLLIST